MPTENRTHARVLDIISEAPKEPGDYDCKITPYDVGVCRAWIISAINAIRVLCPDETNPFRTQADEISKRDTGFAIHYEVNELVFLLRFLLKDIEAGLFISIADRASAEIFDDFLDHAENYLSQSRKQESGVIAGVVFEDSLRRICRKHEIEEKGIKLDDLISGLTKLGILTATKAKRARVAAHVRTKATHAQWDEFDTNDVSSSIEFTRELIMRELDT
jgi:hypothetical protein